MEILPGTQVQAAVSCSDRSSVSPASPNKGGRCPILQLTPKSKQKRRRQQKLRNMTRKRKPKQTNAQKLACVYGNFISRHYHFFLWCLLYQKERRNYKPTQITKAPLIRDARYLKDKDKDK
jgi:hypothetical protein